MVNSVSIVDHMYSLSLNEVWKTILGFVDYALVVFLIFIAFANILRLQVDTYGLKKVLPSLIMGVVLANLSWFICQIILEFSYTLVVWMQSISFVQSPAVSLSGTASSANQSIIGVLYNLIFQPITQSAATVASDGWGVALLAGVFGVTAAVLGIMSALMPVVGLALLIVAAALIFLPWIMFVAIYFILAIRFIVLDFLVVVSPLAFICLGFPMTQKLFQQWWSQFTRWTFMAPLAWFMFALAAIMGNKIQAQLDPQNAQNVLSNAGLAIMLGIVKYAAIIACLYYAIKLPFLLGGGIMNAWGGLGKKLGIHALKAANNKVGDFTEKNKQIFGGRWTPYGQYLGIKARSQEKEAYNTGQETAMGRSVTEAAYSMPGMAWKNKGNLFKKGGIGNLRDEIGAPIQSASSNHAFQVAGDTLNPYKSGKGQDYMAQPENYRTKHINDAKDAIGKGNQGEAEKHLAISAMLGADISDQMQDDFLDRFGKTKSNHSFLQRLANTANSSSNAQRFKGGVGMSAKYNSEGKPRDIEERGKEAAGRFQTEGANNNNGFSTIAAKSALDMLKNSKDEKGNYKADHQSEAAFQFLSENFSRLNEKQKSDFNEFGGKRAELAKGVNDLYTTYDSIPDDDKAGFIKKKVQIVLDPKDTTTNKTNLVHFLKGLGEEAKSIIGGSDYLKLDEAMKKLKIDPASIRPKVKIDYSNVKWANMNDSRLNANNIQKELLNQVDEVPINFDPNIEVNLAGHIKAHTNSAAIKEQMNRVLGNMSKEIQAYASGKKLKEIDMNDLEVKLNENGIKLTEKDKGIIGKVKKADQRLDDIGDAVSKYSENKRIIDKHLEDIKNGSASANP